MAAEEIMTYVENEEDLDITLTGQQNTSQNLLPGASDPSLKGPICMIWLMEESIQRKKMNMAKIEGSNKLGVPFILNQVRLQIMTSATSYATLLGALMKNVGKYLTLEISVLLMRVVLL
jgi:hypothetical protein